MHPQLIANRYRIIESIGEGSMGVVYRATDSVTGEMVAIKSLRSEIVKKDTALIERFEREAQILRQLNHPNIVKALGAVKEEEQYYLVLEYVGGGALRDILEKEGVLSIRKSVEIALDLADALTRAHRLKVIHRDIKPANVLMAEDGTPRLTDFGVARMDSRTRLTQTGTMMGTILYMSPEVCEGKDIDARSDIWSFGAVLFEILTGKNPFEAEHAAGVMYAILNRPTPNIRELRPDIPEALATLIENMLVKDRDQRLSSVRQAGLQLEVILHDLEAKPQSNIPVSASRKTAELSRFSTETPSSPVTPINLESDATFALPGADVRASLGAKESEPKPSGQKRWRWLAGVVGILILAALVALLAGVLNQGDDGEDRTASNPDATLVSSPSQDPNATPITLVTSSVNPGELIVLITQIDGDDDAAAAITESLKSELENLSVASPIGVYEYPQSILSTSEALSVAEANAANVIIWGRANENVLELSVQVGSSANFAPLQIMPSAIADAANVQVQVSDEAIPSLAQPVLGVLTALWTAEGNIDAIGRALDVMGKMPDSELEFMGNTSAVHVHRYFQLYSNDPGTALDEIRTAIVLNPLNPLTYIYSSDLKERLGQLEDAERDAQSAKQLLQDKVWTLPLHLVASLQLQKDNLGEAITTYDQIITSQPEEWFSLTYRGLLHYLNDDYTNAKADLDHAISLQPASNFPLLVRFLIAVHEGQFADAQAIYQQAQANLSESSSINAMAMGTFGTSATFPIRELLSSFNNYTAGQFPAMLEALEAAQDINDALADIYFLEGVGHCNLDDSQNADLAYSRGLELEPDFAMLRLFRAEVRAKMGDNDGVAEDVAAILADHALVERLGPMIQAGGRGEISCKNYFTFELSE